MKKMSTGMQSFYSAADAAAAIGRSRWAVYRMVKAHRIGWVLAWRGRSRLLYVDGDVIDAIVARHTQEALEDEAALTAAEDSCGDSGRPASRG